MKQLKLILKKARYNRGTHQDSSYNKLSLQTSLSLQKTSFAQFVKQR